MKPKKNLLILLLLTTLFFVYNFFIYTDNSSYGNIQLSEKAIRGENLWLKNNCNSCHQIYGLGGYLGPDITNVYSKDGKGAKYIKTILNSGIQTMPKFNFSEVEKDQLVQFFKEVDETGFYPSTDLEIRKDGWVIIKNKNNNAEE